jgi:hypothetical protein
MGSKPTGELNSQYTYIGSKSELNEDLKRS